MLQLELPLFSCAAVLLERYEQYLKPSPRKRRASFVTEDFTHTLDEDVLHSITAFIEWISETLYPYRFHELDKALPFTLPLLASMILWDYDNANQLEWDHTLNLPEYTRTTETSFSLSDLELYRRLDALLDHPEELVWVKNRCYCDWHMHPVT